jgi:hypothetical protein
MIGEKGKKKFSASKIETPSSNQRRHQRHHLDNDRIKDPLIHTAPIFVFLLLRPGAKKKMKTYLYYIDQQNILLD